MSVTTAIKRRIADNGLTAAIKRQTGLGDLAFHTTKYTILFVLLASIVVPYLIVFSVSFRPPTEFYGDPHLIPRNPTLDGWVGGWDLVSENIVNSIFIALGTTILTLVVTIPGAYVFGRKQFPGRKPLFYMIVLALLFPYILLIIPLTSMWYDFGLFNTIPGLWIAYQVIVTPLSLWILRDYFSKMPHNLEEAAQVYGATQFSAFLRVILPLAMPAIIAVGFLAFTIAWNDFLFANMLTTGNGPRPAVVQLYNLQVRGEGGYWAQLTAVSLIIGLPPTAMYLAARRYLTAAFTFS